MTETTSSNATYAPRLHSAIRVAYTVMSAEASTVMSTAFPGGFEESVAAVALADYQGIEAQVENPGRMPVARMREILEAAGLEICSLATGPMRQRGLSLSTPDAARRRQTVDEALALLENARALQTSISFGQLMEPAVPSNNRATCLDLLAESLREICKAAQGVGVRVLIEPQNPQVATLLTSRDAAWEFLRDHQLDPIGVILDTFHVERSGDVPATEAGGNRPMPEHVQIAGEHRGPVGEGDGGLSAFLAVLFERGYQGWITMEHMQTHGRSSPIRSMEGFRRVWGSLREELI